MRYFFKAAGRTFHVGSSKLTLKLFKLSELSCLVGFGVEAETPFGGVTRNLSALFEVEGNDDDPGFRE